MILPAYFSSDKKVGLYVALTTWTRINWKITNHSRYREENIRIFEICKSFTRIRNSRTFLQQESVLSPTLDIRLHLWLSDRTFAYTKIESWTFTYKGTGHLPTSKLRTGHSPTLQNRELDIRLPRKGILDMSSVHFQAVGECSEERFGVGKCPVFWFGVGKCPVH